MYKIATLNKISPNGLSRFGDNYQIIPEVNDAHGIIVRSQDMHSMDFSDNLLAIARAGAGVNNIPIGHCADKGIVVFNTPGANANAVAELVFASLLMDARNLRAAVNWAHTLTNESDVAAAVEKGKGVFAGTELKGKTIGVIGLGAIGVLVANTAEGLGMNVIGSAPYMSVRAAHEMSNRIPFVTGFGDILPKCDYVTIHVPMSESTKGMIDASVINQMKDGAVLLNFSRDKLVNEEDVLAALESGKLKKYITDFPNNAVIGKEGVVYTPHLGASTEEAEDNCAAQAVIELKNYIENGNIENSVNFPNCSLGNFISGPGKSRICVLNKNIPAMLGKITGILADMGVNISNMLNKSKGDHACTIMDIDSDVNEASLKAALSVSGIVSVRVIK